jgi:formylglycine-generating enzyme required for sulfatase activity
LAKDPLTWDRSGTFVRHVVRGGAYNYSPFQARSSYQGFEAPDLTCNDIGFRCAMDARADPAAAD